MKNTSRGFLTIPAAIVIAGSVIALALIWIYKPASTPKETPAAASQNPYQPSTPAAPVTASDHILGNPNAPIKFVEYSDPSCPFCKAFNPTMVDIMQAYGPTGKVAWVYRQFPLMRPVDQSGAVPHPNSAIQAQGFECAAALGGAKAFFDFEKRWFAAFPDDGADRSASVDRAQLDATAKSIGLDKAAFEACIASGRFQAKLDKSYDEAISAGVAGTPTTFLFTPSGNQIPLVGIQDFATLKSSIDTLITTIAATSSLQN